MNDDARSTTDDDDARTDAVVAADDTGMIRSERTLVETELAARLEPLDP